MEEPITLIDRDVLKALAVDTRMNILKELMKGSRTPSDLSKVLSKSDATIVEHLEALIKVGLVKKIEQHGRKWIFYTLTDKGEDILTKKARRLVIILSLSVISVTGGFVLSAWQLLQKQGAPQMKSASESLGVTEASVTQVSSTIPIYIGIFLICIGLLGLFFYIIKQKRG